jgi:hypothetical protein
LRVARMVARAGYYHQLALHFGRQPVDISYY